MLFKRLTRGETVYHVNIERTLYLEESAKGTSIVFASPGTTTRVQITVDQKPAEILGHG